MEANSIKKKPAPDKGHIWIAAVGTVMLFLLYFYSFSDDAVLYHNDNFVCKRFVFITLIYVLAIVLLWIKNRFTDKVNVVISALWFCVTPAICYFSLECMQGGWSALFAEGFHLSMEAHILNLCIYAFVLCLIFCISGSFKISGIITHIIFIILGLTMHYVVVFRGVGLIVSDLTSLGTAMTVAGEYDYSMGFYTYFGLSVGIFGIVGWIKTKDVFKPELRQRFIMWAVAVILCIAFYCVYFKWEKIDREYDTHLWRPQGSQIQLGSAMAFVRSGDYVIVKKPEGYSSEEAQRIADRYKESGKHPSNDVLGQSPNLIVIMNETFSDLQSMSKENFTTNEEVMPFVNSLQENTQKGELHVHSIGGGTAIMEFEMLTGNTNALLPEGIVAYQTIMKETTPSLASFLKKKNYGSIVASHPQLGTNYNRVGAYPLLGFDVFYDIEEFKTYDYLEYIGSNVSDETSFMHIIEQYENANKQSDKPFFEFQVTMQNHSPLRKIEDRDIKITDEKYQDETAELYLNYIHKTDEALKNLINYFENCEEPTLIVFFGDHPPMITDEYYNKLMGLSKNESASVTDLMDTYKTPLVIWANYDIEEKDLGDISLNYVSGLVMENLGIEKSGYQKFLQELRSDIPVINSLGYIDSDGKYYETWDEESPYYDQIREYHVLQYNNLIDTKNRIENFFD